MAVKHASPVVGSGVSVHGLEGGRTQARRRATRRRVKNTIVSGVMFVIAGGIVGGAAYYLWQFYAEEQDRATTDSVVERDPGEIIDQLEHQGPWNGPGAPAFGVGDEQP